MPYTYIKENNMGLDNYWKKSKDEAGTVEGNFQICGGMFSGHIKTKEDRLANIMD